MTPKRLKQELRRLQLTQTKLAKLLGVTNRMVCAWCSETGSPPVYVEAYLDLYRKNLSLLHTLQSLPPPNSP